MIEIVKNKWYAGGLHFECIGCGNCCAGPDEGYIWITKPEIEQVANHLKISEDQFRRKFLRRIGLRFSIIENPATKDCVFLTDFGNGKRGCMIYSVRPNQCRTWPFWTENLRSPDNWNEAGVKCPGLNKGPLHTFEDIEAQRKQKKWWDENEDTGDNSGSSGSL